MPLQNCKVPNVFLDTFRREKELKGFEKISLRPGEEKEVLFRLDARSFALYDTPSCF